MMIRQLSVAIAIALLAGTTFAQEAVIRKNLAERLPALPKIDEVKQTPMPGLWEVRIGTDIHYTDATGSYLLEGELIDLRAKRNLTEERVNKLTAIDFASLSLKDAMMWKVGNGKRRIAVLADPNCGYCKRFERSLQDMKDITVYTFIVPILGGDSPQKARAIWCAKDSIAVWRSWMLDGVAVPRVMGACDDSAIERNQALMRKHKINGTPAILFEDGQRVPGALSAEQLEKRLQAIASQS